MFKLEDFPLPFAASALEPYLSREAVELHHGKHLAGYVATLNGLIGGTGYEELSLEEIIRRSARDGQGQRIFNAAGQVYNHSFFFRCLGRDSPAPFPRRLVDAFGSWENFCANFREMALALFGSGWTWVVEDDSGHRILNSANGDGPVAHGQRPILCLDVWEHAYYLDYRNRRGDYVDAFLHHLISWSAVGTN
ncbi:MAG: superoxide dismutase [Puniceicoccales bacterium]|jgi:Fe-Mn family superoxide dismutase|nr:superoxide dismutase [Puniceicoccales bacterium]